MCAATWSFSFHVVINIAAFALTQQQAPKHLDAETYSLLPFELSPVTMDRTLSGGGLNRRCGS